LLRSDPFSAFVFMHGDPEAADADRTLLVTGPVVDLTDTRLDLGANALVRVEGDSVFQATAPSGGGIVRLNGGSLIADTLISGDGNPNIILMAVTLLDVTGASVMLRALTESTGDMN